MRLQKLTIHNIASIEDAEIDFESQPLSTSEVFLICGKTGAGKSTILDSICLALYATTPRLENTNMEGEAMDVNRELKIYDPRQLMRRNTGEAYVALTFTGRNGVHYEAQWSVARARNKATGNLQAKKWQLTNLDIDHKLTKDKEICDEIQAAVGLEFDQFCRTTMLAQGEFTKFLNSKDKEKAEILEKITGVDIYSKIGKKVFDVTAGKQQAWEAAERLVKDIIVMNEEEIAETNASIKTIESEQAKLKAEREAADIKLKWMNEETGLSQKVAEATAKYNETEAKTREDGFIAKEILTKQWNETIDARCWLRELDAATLTITTQNQTLDTARQKYEELKAGQAWLISDANETEKRLKLLAKKIEAEKDRAHIYENAQTIKGMLETIESGIMKIDSETRLLEKAKERLDGKLTSDKRLATEAHDKAKQDFEEQYTLQKSIEQRLEECRLPELRKEKEAQQEIITNTETASAKIEQLTRERLRHEKIRKDIEDQEKTIGDLNNELASMLPLLNDAQVETDTCRKIFDKQRESVDKWAKSMRARLHIDDTCPVCRQKIVNSIPNEDELNGLFEAAEQSLKDAEKRFRELKEKELSLKSDIRSLTNSLNKAKTESEKDRSLAECEEEATRACQKCGIDASDSCAAEHLVREHDRALTAIGVLNGKIKNAEEIEKALRDSRVGTEKLRKAFDLAKKDVDDTERAIEKCKSEIRTSHTLIQNKKAETAAASEKADTILGDSRWENDHHKDIGAFINELSCAAKRYNDMIKLHKDMEQSIREKKTLIGYVEQPIDAILKLLPDWNPKASSAKEIKNLPDKANNLRTAINASIEQRTAAEITAAKAQSNLDSYLGAHTEMSIAKLSELNSHTAMEIASISRNISEMREETASRKTILEQCLKQQLEHSEMRPELDEEDSHEHLNARIEEIDKKHGELGEKKGELNLLLRQDETNKRTKATLLADADEKKNEYQQWSRINQLIGDATGSKFRKIAQSYVLTNLIHSANSYMQTLSDRYTLRVEPGTFVIMLEDAYQGYASRATSTISGGEGFLVSLALALALSDIGSTLSVDTLFIDEGFGSLSGEPLQKAIDTLRTLHNKASRNVGIISHIEELRERIPVQIQVLQEGNSSSSKVMVIPEMAGK